MTMIGYYSCQSSNSNCTSLRGVYSDKAKILFNIKKHPKYRIRGRLEKL